jgi:hypothetical protein
MAAAFSTWADTIFGFTDVVFVDYSDDVTSDLLTELLNLETTGDSYRK